MKLVKKLTVLLLVVMLAACGKATPKEEEIEIKVLLKTLGGAYWSVVEQGARDAAKELGVKVDIQGLANETEIEKQQDQVDNAITAKPAAIVLAPADSKALAGAAERTIKEGIPLLLVDTLVASEDYDVAYVTNNVNAGKEAAKQMIEQLKKAGYEGKEGKVVIQKGADSQTIIDRQTGFTEYFNENKDAKWEIDSHFLIAKDGEEAMNNGVAKLGDKTIIGVFGTNNGPSVGWARAIEQTGRKEVVAVTFDFSDEVATLIKDASYNVTTIVQKQYMMGYKAVEAGVKLSKGEKVTEKLVDTGTLAVNNGNVESKEVKDIINPGK